MEIRKFGRKSRGAILAAAVFAACALAGCGRTPETIGGTSWKVTALKAPDGTAYDESSYDTLIGVTVYTFGEDGTMSCSIGGVDDGGEEYTYTYEKGTLVIRSEDLECSGSVKKDRIKLSLDGEGEAVLTRQGG